MNANLSRTARVLAAAAIVASFLGATRTASANTVLRNICRIKGQEENNLQGLGLVVGLNGTGESADAPTMRALSRVFEIMGSPIPQAGIAGSQGIAELRNVKNVALVWVQAKVPATGARRGDKLDCTVSGINGKSLAGGRLAFAALQGPNISDNRVYALAEGAIHLDDPTQPLTGRIFNGCQMEEDVFTQFKQNGTITIVLDKNHANFGTATEIVDIVQQFYQLDENQVRALDAANIMITIPKAYEQEPVTFIADLLDRQVYSATPEARVVINERTGSIVLDGNVEIGDVVVSHRNIVVDAGQGDRFTEFTLEKQNTGRLQDLVDALDSLNVSSDDAIEIIKSINRTGKLHGKLIVE